MTNQEDADEQSLTPSHISPFERIRQIAEDASQYWLARDLATVLDYTQWRIDLLLLTRLQGRAAASSASRRNSTTQ